MEFPADLLYTDDDEWLRIEGVEGVVGITDYAQDQLGDIVYIELPTPGSMFQRGQSLGVVESVKAVADLFAPASGEVLVVNEDLADAPELVNESPYERGWMVRFRLEDPEEREGLMDAERHRASRPEATEPGP